MKKEKVPRYDGIGDLELEYPDHITCDDEIRGYQGFKWKTHFMSPFFYINNDAPFIEIYAYRNNEKESILVMFDHNQSLYEFYCKDRLEELECLERYMQIAKNMVEIEKNLKGLHESG